jgi:hypothetical protein
MIYALDTEFIDAPTAAELISLALVSADGRELYIEFPYTESEISPWLREHVVPMLKDEKVSFEMGATMVRDFVGGSKFDPPEFWAYYAAHDWFWFCRLFGGMMALPRHYPHLVRDFANIQQGLPSIAGPEHHALNDARSLMAAMKQRGLVQSLTTAAVP